MRTLILSVALLMGAPAAMACPMADAAAYAAAVEKFKAADGTKVALTVDGMAGGDCSSKVVKALEAIDGVTAAAIDYKTGKTDIAYDSAKTTLEALTAAIVDAGFKVAANS